MRKPAFLPFCRLFGLVAGIALGIPTAHASSPSGENSSVSDREPAQPDNTPANPGEDAPCSNLGVYIFVGGTGGFDGLENGAEFNDLLKTGHVGLYEHGNAIVAAEHSPTILEDIESVFAGTGPGQAELGQVGANYFTLPASDGYYQDVYIGHGLHPTEANIDTPSDGVPPKKLPEAMKLWREYVDAARTAGIETVAPIAGPNGQEEPKLGDHVFATNPYYALERGEALYGKAIAFDVPPNFFLTGGSGPGYQKFIVQAIQWGNEHGIRTTMLLSPYPWPNNSKGNPDYFRQFTNNTFSSDTEKFVDYLTEQNAIPSEWSVDNYEDPYPHDVAAVVPETTLNTTTAIGLWVAQNAPVYVNGQVCRPSASSAGR
jgi:hypothetical protein